MICVGCNELHTKKYTIKLPANFSVRKVKLADSLGFISIAIPNRYDTFYKFGYNPGCGLAIEKQMYKFQPKSLPSFQESGMIDKTEPEIKDQLIISHNKYNASDTLSDSVIIYNYHQRRRHDIMMSPYHGTIEKDFLSKTESGFQSTFVMNLDDTARSIVHKEIITAILKKKSIIVFEYLYVSNKNDSIAKDFITNSLVSAQTIMTNNGY